jgi:hypothetical protein
MINISRKMFLMDKTIFVLILMIVIVFSLTVMTLVFTGNFKSKNTLLKKQIEELQSLTGSVIRLKGIVETKEKRIASARAKGVVSTLEQILKSLGIEAKTIKPLDKKKTNEFTEEVADIEVENIDLNHVVNLLYKIDSSPSPMKINSASTKTGFENPDRFTLKLSVSLLRK